MNGNNYISLLRPSHWIKNLIVFLPLIFGKKLFSVQADIKAAGAFIVFCFASSAVYIINDLIDLPHDRYHPKKKLRPLASGKVSIGIAVALAVCLSFFAVIAAFYVNKLFAIIILIYLFSNLLYSLVLKNMVIIDVMCIALFYILRIVGGLVAIEVVVSSWMVICIGLLALFIGFNKRRNEIELLKDISQSHRSVLGNYDKYFIDQMISLVTASTVIAYTLFTIDALTVARFSTRNLLFTVPFVYYGIFRYLYLVHREGKGGDPVSIFLSDKKMMVNIFLWLFVSAVIIYFKV